MPFNMLLFISTLSLFLLGLLIIMIVVAVDYGDPWGITSDVFIVKNTKYSRDMVDYWTSRDCCKNGRKPIQRRGCLKDTFIYNVNNIRNRCTILKRHTMERAKELLALLNLSDRKNHKPNELSGGEQQRVAVARALMNKPAVVLADEPSGNLDSQNANELHQLFFRLNKELGQTFILVTHNQKLADMSDRKLVMKDGVIVD